MTIDFLFINSFSKNSCNNKQRLKIDSAASTGSQGKYRLMLVFLGLRCFQHWCWLFRIAGNKNVDTRCGKIQSY